MPRTRAQGALRVGNAPRVRSKEIFNELKSGFETSNLRDRIYASKNSFLDVSILQSFFLFENGVLRNNKALGKFLMWISFAFQP